MTEVENKIGYTFKDKDLLRQCFTHASYHNDNKKKRDNERLEFLGDSVLGFVVADYLYKNKHNDEGVMTENKQGIVSKKPLASAIDKLSLDGYLLKNETLKVTDSLKENLFEAIVAGIYLDGGLEEARKFIIKNLISKLKDLNGVTSSDFKSEINEFCAKQKLGTVKYKDKSKKGSDHDPIFEVQAILNDKVLATGSGKSKKLAQQNAAQTALKKLKKMVNRNA